MNAWHYLRREPLVFFIAIGCCLFAADAYISAQRQPQIVIDNSMRSAILAQEEALKGAPLTSAEQTAAVQSYIDNQILFEDAQRLGLDKDRNIQALVIRKYKALLSATIAEPSADELKNYYLTHQQDYINPRRYDIEEYFFPLTSDAYATATSNSLAATERAAWLQNTGTPTYLAQLSEQDLLMRMGKEIAQQLATARLNEWNGPLSNYRGAYFVRITATHEAVPKTYEEVAPYLRDAWVKQQQHHLIQETLAQLTPAYRIHLSQE